jgi:hypothetical protein
VSEEKPPRRWFPRPVDDELVRVDEDPPAPPTQRLPIIPPAPRPPSEPFQLLRGKPTLMDLGNQLQGLSAQLTGVVARQDKMALQADHLGSIVNQRFDVFHSELALLRHDQTELLNFVTSNHGPRIEKVESTLGQKAAKGGGILAIVALALPMLAEALPKYRHLLEVIGGALGQ